MIGSPELCHKVLGTTNPISGNNKGIFGQTKAAYTVTDVQGRLSLHGHMNIWTVLCPKIIQQSIQCNGLVSSIKVILVFFLFFFVRFLFFTFLVRTLILKKKKRVIKAIYFCNRRVLTVMLRIVVYISLSIYALIPI